MLGKLNTKYLSQHLSSARNFEGGKDLVSSSYMLNGERPINKIESKISWSQ